MPGSVRSPAIRCALAVATFGALLPSRAAAQDHPPRVVVLDVAFTGGVPPATADRVRGAMLEAMSARGVEVVPPAVASSALAPLGPAVQGCRAGQCVAWILDVLDADGGVLVDVGAVESSYAMALVVLGPDGNEAHRLERRCDICTFEELAAAAVAAVADLELDVPRRLRTGRIAVRPSPSDTEVSVDGVVVGVGALSIPVSVGRHTVSGTREGHLGSERAVEVEAEETARVDLVLEPGHPPPPPPPPTRPLDPRSFLWSAIGTGAALALAGGVLYAMGTSCIDRGPDGGCERSWDARPTGAGMLGGGLGAALVAAVVATIVSIARPAPRTGPDPQGGPVAASR